MISWQSPARYSGVQKQVIWCFVHEYSQLKVNMLSYWQPMKLPEDGRDVPMPSSVSMKACCSILYNCRR